MPIILDVDQLPVDPEFPITARPGDVGERWENGHRGYDWGSHRDEKGAVIRPILGAPVYAVKDSPVVVAGWHKIRDKAAAKEGREVWIDGPFGFWVCQELEIPGIGLVQLKYAHMSLVTVQRGQLIKKGDIIGKVGSTGNSSAPHLHWQPELVATREILKVNFVRGGIA